jgi:hypothetical protein
MPRYSLRRSLPTAVGRALVKRVQDGMRVPSPGTSIAATRHRPPGRRPSDRRLRERAITRRRADARGSR